GGLVLDAREALDADGLVGARIAAPRAEVVQRVRERPAELESFDLNRQVVRVGVVLDVDEDDEGTDEERDDDEDGDRGPDDLKDVVAVNLRRQLIALLAEADEHEDERRFNADENDESYGRHIEVEPVHALRLFGDARWLAGWLD